MRPFTELIAAMRSTRAGHVSERGTAAHHWHLWHLLHSAAPDASNRHLHSHGSRGSLPLPLPRCTSRRWMSSRTARRAQVSFVSMVASLPFFAPWAKSSAINTHV